MATRQGLSLLAAAAVLGGGLALAPAASAAPGSTTAKPAAVAQDVSAAKAKNAKCALKTAKWTTCKGAGKVTVKKGKTLLVELVSSGNKAIDLRIANANSKALAKKSNVKPGSGYVLSWTNNSSKSKVVKIQADRDVPVKVNANIRYKLK
ncbi:hypothetical protein [Streptomyces sp. SID14515]|uniref:hypothetical protein n=1 Tax=Streptomyces sp. SID14515 TaxID=2706074 RepID=UPI0013C67CDE|nr:hypothetical protein [Streptomyces sp. SID14515]NEB38930.1 hypothetical protein [Streptomyces sp. SID14515]